MILVVSPGGGGVITYLFRNLLSGKRASRGILDKNISFMLSSQRPIFVLIVFLLKLELRQVWSRGWDLKMQRVDNSRRIGVGGWCVGMGGGGA